MSECKTDPAAIGRREQAFWLVLLLGLCGWVAWRLGAFDLTRPIVVDGGSVSVPNVYAWVDHPFHAARAHDLLEALKRGEILRWVGNHQGGYPAEFYPLGIAWFDVAIWAVLLGSQSIVAVHKLAVILIFLLPAVSFWLLARGDRFHPAFAVLAAAIHFAVPGTWLNGGYTELVVWGLVTNVAGGSLAVLASVALARFVLNREFGMGILAILAAAAGACTNPRSLFAVVIAATAILAVATAREGRAGAVERLRDALLRIGIVGGLAVLLAAPVVLALFRYNGEYFFLHYQFYDPLSMFWTASVTAVTLPVLLVAVIGTVGAVATRIAPVSLAMAVSLVGYVLFTAWVATSSWTPPLVEQLEAPRLMPYQRQLMIWMAVAALAMGLRWVAARWEQVRTWWIGPVLATAIGLGFLVVLVKPFGFVTEEYQGLTPVGTVADAEFVQYRQAVIAASDVAPEGTAILTIGNRDDWWHELLWAPTVTDTPMYYDDWLWYWNTRHPGPFDYRDGTYYPDPALALTEEYFEVHGIGAVVVTDRGNIAGHPREKARTSDLLAFQETVGEWDVYSVRQPTPLITDGGEAPSRITVANGRLTAAFDDGDGTVVIRENWFPRWKVYANGEPVPVVHRDDGYMEVRAPAGVVEIDVIYGVTALDWVGRGLAVVGVIGVAGFVAGGRRLLAWPGRPVGAGSISG